jgi:hypothetical protein
MSNDSDHREQELEAAGTKDFSTSRPAGGHQYQTETKNPFQREVEAKDI